MKLNRFLLIIVLIGQIIICWACYDTGYWRAKHQTELIIEETLELANQTIKIWMKFKSVESVNQAYEILKGNTKADSLLKKNESNSLTQKQ